MQSSTTRKTLFLIEDSELQADYFKFHFEQLGYNVITANEGSKALTLLRQQLADGDKVPDLIVLDLGLPQLSGVELCRVFKSDVAIRNIPILVFSVHSQTRIILEAYQAGADYYVAKEAGGFVSLELLISVLLRKRAS